MQDKTFKVMVDGNLKEYEIIKILAPKNSEYRYIVYKDDNDTFASRYIVKDNEIILKDIENESEWNYIDERLGKINNE